MDTYVFRDKSSGHETKELLGFDAKTYRLQVMNYFVKLIIIDISGKNRRKESLRSCGGIIAFVKGDRDSFEAITDFYREFYEVNPQDKVPLSIVGLITKSKEITTEEGQSLANELGVPYYETKPLNNGITVKVLEELTLKMIDSGHCITDD